MMYGPGLPLLTPLCALSFALFYRMDKVPFSSLLPSFSTLFNAL